MTAEPPASSVLTSLGVDYRAVEYEPVSSLEEAAAQRGVNPADIVKTIVARISDESYVFVLVPGDRAISRPKLRAHLGTRRLALPDPATAQAVTGYVRGTIAPLGSSHAWPVVAGSSIRGRTVALGSGPLIPTSRSMRTPLSQRCPWRSSTSRTSVTGQHGVDHVSRSSLAAASSDLEMRSSSTSCW